MNVSLYIKEQKVEAIINSDSIRVQLNNDTNDPDAKSTVSTNSLELTIDGAAIVNRYIEDAVLIPQGSRAWILPGHCSYL